MNSLKAQFISTEAEIIVVKFGNASAPDLGQGNLKIDAGKEADRNVAQIWMRHIAPNIDWDNFAKATRN